MYQPPKWRATGHFRTPEQGDIVYSDQTFDLPYEYEFPETDHVADIGDRVTSLLLGWGYNRYEIGGVFARVIWAHSVEEVSEAYATDHRLSRLLYNGICTLTSPERYEKGQIIVGLVAEDLTNL